MPLTYMPSAAVASSSAVAGSYSPFCALELAHARWNSLDCAATTLSSLPAQVFRVVFWSARAYEKETCHGFVPWFIALRFSVAWISDWPPERKNMPGTAGGTTRFSAPRVYSATVFGSAVLPDCAPGVTMDGFRYTASRHTPKSAQALKTAAQVSSNVSRHSSMSCSPSRRISGSMMGTRPEDCQMLAQRASPWAASATAIEEW